MLIFVFKVVEYKLNDKEENLKGYVRFYLAPKIEENDEA